MPLVTSTGTTLVLLSILCLEWEYGDIKNRSFIYRPLCFV